jgi:hypothetical protein
MSTEAKLDLFRPVQEAPCKKCPFRRQSLPGWLGADSPEGFVRNVLAEEPLPCHTTINYEEKDWAEKWAARRIGKLCRGAAIFAANIGKKPRPASLLPIVAADSGLVFKTPQEFTTHHRSLGIFSWDEPNQIPRERKPTMPKPKPLKAKKPNQNQSKVHDVVDTAVEEILQEIDSHELSGTTHPKSTSREFWQGIVDGLQTRLSALGGE